MSLGNLYKRHQILDCINIIGEYSRSSSGCSGSAHSPSSPSNEDDGEDKPKHVAEDDKLHHVQVRPAYKEGKGQTDNETPRNKENGAGGLPAQHEVRACVQTESPDCIWNLFVILVQLTVVSCEDLNRRPELFLKHLQLQRGTEEEQEVI